MPSPAPSDLLPREAHDGVRLRVDPVDPRRVIVSGDPIVAHQPSDPQETPDPHGQTGPGLLVAPLGDEPARTAEGDMSRVPCGPATRRTVSADPGLSLGLLGWLAVLLAAALLTVLAHAANVRASEGEYREPSLLVDPAYVLAQ